MTTARRGVALAALVFLGLGLPPGRAELSPHFDPATMMLPSEVTRGMKAQCRTVFRGTDITEFNIELISVLPKANLGGDLIIFRALDGPLVERGAGILQGMSGSPVYVDGRLLGAVSRTFGGSKEPLGMITPIADMLPSLDEFSKPPTEPGRTEAVLETPIQLDGRAVRRVIVADATWPGMSHLPADTAVALPVSTPVYVSGLTDRGFQALSAALQTYNIQAIVGPASADPDRKIDLQPGSACSLTLVRGDMDMSAGGTLTYRQGDRILAFGHSMMGFGPTDLPLAGAEVNEFVPGINIGFKVMSPYATVGTIYTDTNWAVGGILGRESASIRFDVEVANESTGQSRTFHLELCDNSVLTLPLLLSAASSAMETVTCIGQEATADVTTEVVSDRGTLSRHNVCYDQRDVTSAALSDLIDGALVMTRNVFDKARVKSAQLRCVIRHGRTQATLENLEIDDYVVRPGETISVGVVLRLDKGERVRRTLELVIPHDTPTCQLQLGVTAGALRTAVESRLGIVTPDPRQLGDLLELYQRVPPQNRLVALLPLQSRSIITKGVQLHDIPVLMGAVVGTAGVTDLAEGVAHIEATEDTPWDVQGALFHPVIVIRPEDTPTEEVLKAGESRGRVGGQGAPSQVISAADTQLQMSAYVRVEPALRQLLADLGLTGRLTSLGGPALDQTPAQFLGDSLRPSMLRSLSARPGAPAQRPRGIPDLPGLPDAPDLPDIPEGAVTKVAEGEAEGEATKEASEAKASEEGKKEKEDTKIEAVTVRGPETWTQATREDFGRGKLSGLAVSDRGEVTLSAPLSVFCPSLPALYPWDCALGDSGELLVATGPEGAILRVDTTGRAAPFFTVDDTMVFSLVRAADGTIYAGTGPKGLIYRISPDGAGEVVCHTGERYVFDLLLTRDGELLAATGPHGRILRVSGDEPQVIYEGPERHVLVLCQGEDGTIYAGTGDKGSVLRIHEGGATVVCQSPMGAVHALVAGKDGAVYFGGGSTDSTAIFRVSAKGDVERLYGNDDGALLAMATDDDGHVYAGTSVFARLLVADSAGHVALLGEASDLESQFLCLTLDRERRALYGCAANPARIYRADMGQALEGTLESAVFDATAQARWTSLEYTADMPEGTEVTVEVRSGGTAVPDATWSTWSRPYSKPDRQRLDRPDGRYCQYRATLRSQGGGALPVLKAVRVSYLKHNARPTIAFDKEIPRAASGELELSWKAEDPNGDKLTYSIDISRDGGRTWKTAKSDIEESTAKWDTSGEEDGTIVLRVVASDAKRNPTDPLTNEAISKPMILDNSGPTVSLLKGNIQPIGNGAIHVRAWAEDTGSGVGSAQYRVDEGKWVALPAEDGLFDSSYEAFEFDIKDLSGGEHTIQVAAFNAAGKEASASVKCTVEGPPAEGKPADSDVVSTADTAATGDAKSGDETTGEPPADEGAEAGPSLPVATEEPAHGPVPEAPADAAELCPRRDIVARTLERSRGIEDFTVRGRGRLRLPKGASFNGQSGTYKGDFVGRFKRPDKIATQGDPVGSLFETVLAFVAPETIIEEDDRVKVLGVEEVDGTEADLVWIEDPDGDQARLWISRADSSILKLVLSSVVEPGSRSRIEMKFTWTSVNDMPVPMTVEVVLPPEFVEGARGPVSAALTLTGWQINTGLNDELFPKADDE